MISVVKENNPQKFLQAIESLASKDKVIHNIPYGVVRGIASGNSHYKAWFLWKIKSETEVIGFALQTENMPVLLSKMDDAAVASLNAYLQSNHTFLRGFTGPQAVVEKMDDLWRQDHKVTIEQRMDQLFYQLRDLKIPDDVTGKIRIVGEHDRLRLQEWLKEFTIECYLPERKSATFDADIAKMAEMLIEKKSIYFWDVESEAVSMSGIVRKSSWGQTISYVYTPNKLRRKGYASALVAHLANMIKDQGDVFINTDARNLSSNRAYTNIGFELKDKYLMISYQ